MSSSDEPMQIKYQMLLILSKDPMNSRYRCLLTTCEYECSSISSILSHMWKFKATNHVNKSCTGQTSPSLTLYPKLFEYSKFHNNTLPTISSEYPDIDWHTIQKYIAPPDESAPKISKLIEEFDMFITSSYLEYFPRISIPDAQRVYILDRSFDPRELPSLLYSIKHSVHEPPRKKRKLSRDLSVEEAQTTLSLPSLNILSPNTSKSEEECMLNLETLFSPIIIPQKTHKKRRGIGPICSACATELNPCDAMVQCTECEYHGREVMICVFCFKSGHEFASHKRYHRYNVLRPLPDLKLQQSEDENSRYKISHSRWCGNDEWNLLHGLRRYGLGNWSQITKMINKNSPQHKHYECKFIEQQFYKKYGEKVYKKEEEEKMYKKTDCQHVEKRGGDNKFTDKHKRKCGYREMRDEFEAEWNNNAEAMIGEMYFSPYDTEKERALKLEGIRIYNTVLKEREIRKKFIKHYGVICRNPKKRNMSEQDLEMEHKISDNLAVFARYTADKSHNFAEFRSLSAGLLDEYRLRQKIDKIRHYLLNGVTSVKQMETIEKYMKKQQELKENQDDDDDDDEDVAADEYLNRYHGCSLDAISTYLKLIDSEQKNNKKREEKPYAYRVDDDHNVKKMESAHLLNEGEKKLCNVLKITPKDYQHIQREIAKKVQLFGLMNHDKAPQQLYIDIDDNKNVQQTMEIKIGLVDPIQFD